MNARLTHFLHYIQANDAGQYNFYEKAPGDGWITTGYKTCFENLFHSRKILIDNKWKEFGKLKDKCAAVSDRKPAMESAQKAVDACKAKVSEKQQAVNKLQEELERKNKYSKLYKEWETIKDKIDTLNDQISNLSNDPRESKHAPIAPPSDADRGKITKPKLTPAWASAQPPEKNNTPRNLCDRLKKHYLHIKNEEKDFLMTKESINARISAADNELKDMDFSRVSESDFVNHHAKFGLGGIFTMKRFSYLLKMRYRHERFLKNNENNENNEVKIYEKLMENFSSNFESSPRGLFDGLDLEGLEKSMERVLNGYFQDLKDFSLFSGNEGYRKSKDFSKALHIQDRLQLLSQYLAKAPNERMGFCSSFQASDECEMRGQRKGRFLRILSVNCLKTLKKNNPSRGDNIDKIIEHLECLPVSSGVKVYKAVQEILKNEGCKLDLGIGFFEFSHRSHEKDLEAQLKALAQKVQKATSTAEGAKILQNIKKTGPRR